MVTMYTSSAWQWAELSFLGVYALGFYAFLVLSSIRLSTEFAVVKGATGLRGLQPGWIFGRFVDMSDIQWRNFRGNLPALTMAMFIFTLLYRGVRCRTSQGQRWFWVIASLGYLSYLHGTSIIFVLTIALGNYALVKVLGSSGVLPIFLWIYNLAFLVANRIFDGYSFASFGDRWAFLDRYRGALPWHISFNLVMLRMVSFGFDYHWAVLRRPSTIDFEKHKNGCYTCASGGTCFLLWQEIALPQGSYNIVMYISYLLFPPLYIAGPIISYNAFAAQLGNPWKDNKDMNAFAYGLRWLGCLLLMELLTHFCYFNAFAISGIWKTLSPVQIFIVGYGVLNFMWLKFLLIWRFFRFWSMMNGVDPPENMLRCVNNCYSLAEFWKSWHASYNRWLVRYMYIPLGGAQWRLLNVWVIFTFVALWHDLEWKLLSWAWVMCLLWAPELSIRYVFNKHPLRQLKGRTYFGECCAAASALNIAGLMIVNLIGFVAGPSGMRILISNLFRKQNTLILVGILFSLYIGAKIMFKIREYESLARKKEFRE